jgi:hypothetical protein
MKSQTMPIKLPSRSALTKIGKSDKTISDYAKATPFSATDTVSPLLQLMRKPKEP